MQYYIYLKLISGKQIKQNIRTYIYVAYSRQNGWTDWADIFWDTHGWPVGVLGLKIQKKFQIFFHRQRRLFS